jgi:hypothetical protein
MQRRKSTGDMPLPRPGPWWLAGAMIGGTIASIAMAAMVLGTGAAIQATLNAPRRPN